MEASLVGQTLGAYRIIEQIGRGGMATVYKAYEPALDRYVAIKVLPQYFAHDPDFAARFEREAKAVARLNHPNILPIYSFGQEAGWSYIVMRYVEAGTLKEMLEQPLDLKTAADILGQIGSALDYAHQHGIVHRDVKPTNVLMAEGKWALLSDFGLARMVESSVQLTKTGVGVGTPAYMSPEQGQGLQVDARSDVYSLGVVLYEMLTGRVPYEAETPMAVIIKHITAPLPMPRQVNPAIPEAVERVILKAMAKAPKDRYQTAGEMVEALERAVARAAEVREAAVPLVGEVAEVKAPVPGVRPVVERVPAAPAAGAKPERRIQWGKIVSVVVGMSLFILIGGMVFWATRHREVPEPTQVTVEETPAPTSTPSSAEQARAFAEPILAIIAGRPPDYEDGFSDPGSGWPSGSTAAGDEWGYQDDAYSISATYLPQGDCCISARPDPAPSFSDFVLEMEAQFVSDTRGAWFVIFRDSQETREQQPVGAHYGMRFYPDGTFRMWKNVSGTHVELMETEIVAPAFKQGFETNRLTIITRGPQMAVYVNGEPLWFVRDGSSSRGTIQLGVTNETEGTMLRVRFDNLKVWDLSGVALPAQPDAVVTAEALNVRAGPGADHDRVGVLRQGDGLDVVARTPAGDWLKVIAPDGTEGWVAALYVALNIALDEVPLPPPPPGKIVYADERTGNQEIYVANSDGSDERRLTDHPARDWAPTWSPDGRRIVFSSDRDAVAENNNQLYVMDADGSNLTRLTHTERNDITPSWSPDGSRIAFHSWCGLAVINADGSNWTMLIEGHEELCVALPTWSPDSHRIAFRSVTPPGGPPPLQHEIYVVNENGSGLLKLATFTSEEWGWYVAWSPDGSQVAFDIKLDGQQKYYAVNSNGGDLREIAHIPPSWYPNFWPQWAEVPAE